MTQNPYSYASGPGYTDTPGRVRPTSVTTLGIIGIVFGVLMILCIGFGLAMSTYVLATGARSAFGSPVPQLPRAIQIANVILSVIFLALEISLVVASVMSLTLKPAGLRLMRGWAVVMLGFATVHLLLQIVWIAPASAELMKQQLQGSAGRPGMPPGLAQSGLAILIASAVFGWVIYVALPVCVLLIWRGPQIEAAFSGSQAFPPGYMPPPQPPFGTTVPR